ncbi:C4-type zinc ribbon domain-containing protein [Porphyromonadaceae bacterium W3.11]|nr:C4-type zinc ribbon domain-containing protein [Porphyromonadaceae bacterium W3.11]
MAKKIENELSIEDRLKALYELQVVSSEIDRIRTLRGELPLEVQELEDQIEGRNTRLQKIDGEIKKLKGYIEQSRERIRIAQNMTQKYQEQLNSVRNDREYDALNKELENQSLDIQLFEKNIREDQERIQELKDSTEAIVAEIDELKEEYNIKSTELDEIISETRQEEEKLRMTAKELEEVIEPRVLKAFKRTRKSSHNGLAVASIDRGACMGCFNKIPPQRVLDVNARKKVIACEYCGRVLVDNELAQEVESKLDIKK